MLGDVYFPLPPAGPTPATSRRRRRLWRPSLLRACPCSVRKRAAPWPLVAVAPPPEVVTLTTLFGFSQSTFTPNQPLSTGRYRR